jgi:voltage-gated potassium channel
MKQFTRQIQLFKKLLIPFMLLGGTIVMGTLGYMIIEKFRFFDALYMTVITIGSVGYMEVHPLSEAGRLFTIFLIIINIGLITYFITLLSRYLLDGEFLKQYKQIKMLNAIEKLKQHVIICGLGRNGRECAQVLQDNKIPYVVVEEKEAATAEDPGFKVPYSIKGDATKDEVLIEAGIHNARALITTLPVDADNLFVVLTARQINPGLTIISRASQDSSVNKLKIGGATNVIMPDKIGGAHMATLVMIPDVVELMSLLSATSNDQFKIVELEATQTGTTLRQLNLWQQTGCTVLSVKDRQNHYLLNPGPEQPVTRGDRLIIMGSAAQIEAAKKKI